MIKLNVVLFVGLILCALGLVESQYRARMHYSALEDAKKVAMQYELNFKELMLEQGARTNESRIERYATNVLNMQVPDSSRVQVVNVAPQLLKKAGH